MNIDEAMELIRLRLPVESFKNEATNWKWVKSTDATEAIEAEVERLREFSEAQQRYNEQLRDRIKVLESQAKPPTAEESRGTFEATLKLDGIGIGRYEWQDKFDYIDYEARKRWHGWQAAIEWVTKRQ